MISIKFNQVSKTYENGRSALRNLNFSISAGEMVFLTGHSGAGKSTLLKLLMRIERPTEGEIWAGDRNLANLSRQQLPVYRRGLGVIYQDHRLLGDRNVFENIALPLRISGFSEAMITNRVRAALSRVGLQAAETSYPQMLSSGQQQRIGIARAIVNRPSLLIADEPTGNLDPRLSKSIMKLFEQFNQVGTTVLIATHDLALIDRMHHRQLVLSQGRLQRE